ncbi:MAG: TlpA family protein disulfide reductase [Planctomycetota bacterium]|jgi:thiol-disulfide isomerase/thioredoxin
MTRTLLLAILLCPAAFAQDLIVGSDAPALEIKEWVKGDPVTIEKGKVYVVEFWATWCGPCIASMPHLSELQDRYKDRVTIIGVTKGDRNNTIEAVKEMVKEKGPGMGYTVAWDSGKCYRAYMTASGSQGIPTAFIVDKESKIAFIGHPGQMDIPLRMIVEGTWTNDPQKIQEIFKKINEKLQAAMKVANEDPKKGRDAIDDLLEQYPEMESVLGRYQRQLLLTAKDWDGFDEHAKRTVEKAIKYRDPDALNDVAWTIVDPKGKVERRDFELALKAAVKAVEFSRRKDAAILDTLARVWAWKGDFDKAVEFQAEAVALQESNAKEAESTGNEEYIEAVQEMLAELQAVLKEYEEKKAG